MTKMCISRSCSGSWPLGLCMSEGTCTHKIIMARVHPPFHPLQLAKCPVSQEHSLRN